MPMRFPYLKAARVKLQERKNACLKSSFKTAEMYVTYFLQFIRSDPVIASIAAELSLIAQKEFPEIGKLISTQQRSLILPADTTQCAGYHLRLLDAYVNPDEGIPHFLMIFGRGSKGFQDITDDFLSQVLIPLCSYIDERIDDGDFVLYALSRYQRECVWFETAYLNDLATSAESRKLEEVMDQHLRSWLFRDGFDYPFSTPKSPSGRSDIIVWHAEAPLPIEVKVYDGKDRDLGHVSQGLWQAHRYANDYGKAFGYLVVFNISSHLLSYEANMATDGPPCVVVGGLHVFAISINLIRDRESASKEKPIETKLVKLPA